MTLRAWGVLVAALLCGCVWVAAGCSGAGTTTTTYLIDTGVTTTSITETTSTTSSEATVTDAVLFPIRVDGRWGYIDRTGAVVVEPQFDEAYPFSEGLGRIGIDQETVGKFGFVDVTGSVVIEPQFSWASDFSEGLAKARASAGGKNGYIDTTGAWAIEPRFANNGDFYEGLAWAQVEPDGLEGYVDPTGIFVIELEPRVRITSGFSEGLAVMETAIEPGVMAKKGYIDKTGAWVIEPLFTEAERFSEGLAFVGVQGEAGEEFGYIDKTGALVFEVRVPEVEPASVFDLSFSEGLATWVGDNGRAGYIDTAGVFVIEPQFAQATPFSEGLAAVCMDINTSTWGYIDKTGAWVIDPRFRHAEPYSHGLARVTLGTKQAYVDPAGEVVWQAP